MLAIFFIVAAAYAGAVPPLEGFDVQAHYAAANFFQVERKLPDLTTATLQHSYELITQPPLYHVAAAAAGSFWPAVYAADYLRDSINPYFEKVLSYRQSVDLPTAPEDALAPIWAARLVSILGGLMTLLAAWWMARDLAPERPSFALAAAAVAVLNPVLLFLSVTITNDAWAAGTAGLTLALGIDAVLRRRSPAWWFWIGASLGVTVLTKYSGLLLVAPLSTLWLLDLRRQGARGAAAAAAWAGLGLALLAGWWFARNCWLYGEPVPLQRMAAVIQSLHRAQPLSLEQTLAYGPWLQASFWGIFVSLFAPGWYLDVTHWFMWIGLAGALLAVVRSWRRPPVRNVLLFVILPWLALTAGAVLYWTSTVSYGEQGRLGHIAAASFGVAMAAGWQAFAPRRWQPAVHGALVTVMGALALSMALFLQQSYSPPPALAGPLTPDRPLDVHFEGGMHLIGVDFPEGAALEPGKAMPVTLYFTADRPITRFYTLFLHLADSENRLLFQHDGPPVEGRHATRQWAPGAVFADRYQVMLQQAPADGVATLSMGFYPVKERNNRQQAYDAAGNFVGDRVVLGAVRLHSQPSASDRPAAAPAIVWENGIALAHTAIMSDSAGLPIGIHLTWSPTATIQSDFTVFAQVLDAGDHVLAQVDRQPQYGQYPTSTWRRGDVITDTFVLQGDVTAWDRIIVGIYGADRRPLALLAPHVSVDNAAVVAARVKPPAIGLP